MAEPEIPPAPVAVPSAGRAVVGRALDAYAELQLLGETIEEEWLYVTELGRVYRARLEDLGERLGHGELPPETAAAIDEAIAEIGLISDPHRAIDWLSTFPQVVALALGPALAAAER